MSSGYSDLERARRGVDPAWTPRKLEEELARLETRVDGGKRLPWLGMSAVGVAGACAAMLLWWPAAEPSTVSTAPRATAPQVDRPALTVADTQAAPKSTSEGSTATLAQAKTASDDATNSKEAEPGAEPAESNKVQAQSSRVKMAASAWRSLAKEGRYKEAYRAMRGSEPDRIKSEVDELLLAGDAARLSGHAREALPYYRAALDKAGKDPRAHLTAFTLGRTLLNDLHEPRPAAEAFARAYQASPRGPLAEEALAREAESWTRAGDLQRAKQAADRYQAAYPQGRLLKR